MHGSLLATPQKEIPRILNFHLTRRTFIANFLAIGSRAWGYIQPCDARIGGKRGAAGGRGHAPWPVELAHGRRCRLGRPNAAFKARDPYRESSVCDGLMGAIGAPSQQKIPTAL